MTNKITEVVRTELYSFLEPYIIKNDSKIQNHIKLFIQKNNNAIFDIAPYTNIMYNAKDLDDLYHAIGITEKDIDNIIKSIYYYDLENFNPRCAKSPYVLLILCIIRYYIINKMDKKAEITCIYLLLSGKFYASIYALFFAKMPINKNKSVMDYVVNNMMSDKFDLKREGNIFGALKSITNTYLNTYKDRFLDKNMDDEDAKLLLQFLHDRLKSFFKNIANLYFEAYTNKLYMNYETDDASEDNFRLTVSDSTSASRLTESTMNALTSTYISLDLCNKCKNTDVKALEIKDIMESIIGDKNNLDNIRKVISTLICDFMRSEPGHKVGNVDFIAYSLKMKPNTKDKDLINMKNIILNWLDENSANYRKRKSRTATAISYYKSILMYFILLISKTALKIGL